MVLSCYVIYVSGFSIRHVFGNKGIGTAEKILTRKRDANSPGETYIFGHGRKRSAGYNRGSMTWYPGDSPEGVMVDEERVGDSRQDYQNPDGAQEVVQQQASETSKLLDEFVTFLALKERGLLDICLDKRR